MIVIQGEDKSRPEERRINMNIKEITSTIELGELAEEILSNYPADDHAGFTYGESADLIESQAESMFEENQAKELRELESRWFELEA